MLPTPEIVDANYERVYDPAEDSYLLLDLFESLQEYLGHKTFAHAMPLVVEIGTGTGIVSSFINKYVLPKAYFVATDINPYAVVTAVATNRHNKGHSTNYETIRCDLTSALRLREVDLLVFNPPYVPTETIPSIPTTKEEEDSWVDLALNGGPEGMDVTGIVIDQLDSILSPKGEAYILFCARNKPEKVAEEFKHSHTNFIVERVIFRKAGWEELSVYRFKKS